MFRQEFTLLPNAHPIVERCLTEGKIIGEGAFAQVFELDSNTVLKLTACQATINLFDRIIAKPVRGIVKVLRGFGPVALDQDGITYYAYVVERLYSKEEWRALPNVKRNVRKRKHVSRFYEQCGQRRRVSLEEKALSPLHEKRRIVRKGRQDFDAVVQRINLHVKKHLKFRAVDHRQKGHDLFWNMKRQVEDAGVIRALSALEDMMAHENAELDLLIDGNVLLTRDGEVTLSDPVTEMMDNTFPPPLAPMPYLTDQIGEDQDNENDNYFLPPELAELARIAPMFRLT
jgi:hypothetical protein